MTDPPLPAQAGSIPKSSYAEASDLLVLAKGGMLSLGGVVVSGVSQILFVVVVSRSLGARGAGSLFEAIALFMIVANVTEFGADTGLVRTIPFLRTQKRDEQFPVFLKVASVPVVLAALSAAIAIYVLAPFLARTLMRGSNVAEGVALLRVFAPFLPVAALSTVLLASTRGFGTMVPFVAVENVTKPLLRLLFFLAAVWAGLGTVAIGLSWTMPIALGLLLAVAAVRRLMRQVRAKGHTWPDLGGQTLKAAGTFWRFAAPRGLAAIFQLSSVWIGVLLLGALASTRDAGVFAAVNRLAIMGTFALNAINLAMGPQISALLAGDERRRAESLFQTGTWWLMSISWPLYIALGVLAPFVLRVFGAEFVGGESALLILSVAMLINMGTGNCHIVLLMAGKSSWNLANTVVAITINLVLGFVLIPHYGATGAAIAWAVAIVVDNLATAIEVRWFLGLRPFGIGFVVVGVGALACFGLTGIAIRALWGLSPVSVSVFLSIAVASYAWLLWRYRNDLRVGALREAFGAAAAGTPRRRS